MSNPALTVVIPVYDLKPILGPLGIPSDVCGLINEYIVAACTLDVKIRCGHSDDMIHMIQFVSVYDPVNPEPIRDRSRDKLSVWYSAMMSHEYGISMHLSDLIEYHRGEVHPYAMQPDYVMERYVERVSKLMCREPRKWTINLTLTGVTADELKYLSETARNGGVKMKSLSVALESANKNLMRSIKR